MGNYYFIQIPPFAKYQFLEKRI